MVAWRVIKKKKNGRRIGEQHAFSSKETAEYIAENQTVFCNESVFVEEINFEKLNNNSCILSTGKKITIYNLSLEEAVKYFALKKLSETEKRILKLI